MAEGTSRERETERAEEMGMEEEYQKKNLILQYNLLVLAQNWQSPGFGVCMPIEFRPRLTIPYAVQ